MKPEPEHLVEAEVCTEGTLLTETCIGACKSAGVKTRRLGKCLSFCTHAVVQWVNYCVGSVKWC